MFHNVKEICRIIHCTYPTIEYDIYMNKAAK